MPDGDLDMRIRALLEAHPLPPLAAVPSPGQLRLRGRARALRRRLALAATAVAVVAGIGWTAVPDGHTPAQPAVVTSTTAWPKAPRSTLDHAHATVADYYARLPATSHAGAVGQAELKALEQVHLTPSLLAEATRLPQPIGGPDHAWLAVCGDPALPLRVGPLRQTGPDRATAVVSGTPGPTIITIALATGLITDWACA